MLDSSSSSSSSNNKAAAAAAVVKPRINKEKHWATAEVKQINNEKVLTTEIKQNTGQQQ
jgi:hypothetical protein